MKLNQLKPSITDVPEEVGMEIVLSTRTSRMTRSKKKKKKKIKNPVRLLEAFTDEMSEDELDKFIKDMEKYA